MTDQTTSANQPNEQTPSTSGFSAQWLIGVGIGAFAAGLIAAGFLMVTLMPSMMIVTHESQYGFDETVERIQAGIPEIGWSSPGMLNINQSLQKHDVALEPQVKIIQMCQPNYAKQVLESNRDLSCMMPCAVAVWEGDDGTVYISKMNTGLMGKMFGGTVAEVMGNKVSADENQLLNPLFKG